MEKLKYMIGVHGCDDSTEFEIELTMSIELKCSVLDSL